MTGVALITVILLAVHDTTMQVQLLTWIFVMRILMIVASGVSYLINSSGTLYDTWVTRSPNGTTWNTFNSPISTATSDTLLTGFGGTFMGDYTGLAVSEDEAFPIWPDTRVVDLFLCDGTGEPGVPPELCTGTEPNGLQADDQDIYTAGVHLP